MLSIREIERLIIRQLSNNDSTNHTNTLPPDLESNQFNLLNNARTSAPIAGLYFLAYGIPLFAVSFSLAVDANSSPYKALSQSDCFPSSIIQSKVFQFTIIFPFSISFILIVAFYVFAKYQIERHIYRTQRRPLEQSRPTSGINAETVRSSSHNSTVVLLNDQDGLDAQFQLSGFLTIAILLLGVCCTASTYVRYASDHTQTYRHHSIDDDDDNFTSHRYRNYQHGHTIRMLASILYSFFSCAIALIMFYIHSARHFQRLWHFKNQLHQDNVKHCGQEAMQYGARKIYERQRCQFSLDSSNVQDAITEGSLVMLMISSSNKPLDINPHLFSSSIRESFTNGINTNDSAPHLQTDDLNERRNEMASVSIANSFSLYNNQTGHDHL